MSWLYLLLAVAALVLAFKTSSGAILGLSRAAGELVNANVVKGGLYALIPIAMAFVFSLFHGNFTGCFWSSCGIEASKKTKEVK